MINIGVTGPKNSGKTTLIEKLVSLFVQAGYKVATVKHTSHDHLFDTPGKDSYKHREAGAGMTLAVSQKELALFAAPNETHIQAVLAMMGNMYDICFIEGDRHADHQKIYIIPEDSSRTKDVPSNIIAYYGAKPDGTGVPYFSRDDISGLFQFLRTTFTDENKEVVDEHH